MKDRFIARSVTVAVAAIALAGAGSTAAFAQTPIAPNQHFVGVVNGVEGSVTVNVVCPGPAGGKHRTGRVQRGQTMQVVESAHGHGDTGQFSKIYAWFQPVKSGTRPVMLRFGHYGVPRDIPRSVRVPCGGKGKAVFSSCQYLAPSAAGFVPDTLRVTFDNTAARPSGGRMLRHR